MSKVSSSLLSLAALLLAAPHAAAQIRFDGPLAFAVPDSSPAAAIGDFDEDGNVDVAVASREESRVSVFLGDGLAGFAAPLAFAAGASTNAIAAADFNNDAHVDLVVANDSYPTGSVTVLAGDGRGNFVSAFAATVAPGTKKVVADDVFPDGNVDFLATDTRGGVTLNVFRGDGTFRFARSSTTLPGFSNPVPALADMNRDGRIDILLGRSTGTTSGVSLLLSDGFGRFAESARQTTGQLTEDVDPADLDDDGDLDVVVSGCCQPSLFVLSGDGEGGLDPARVFDAGAEPTASAVADFDEDGHWDVMVASSFYGSSVSFLRGDGAGRFAPPVVSAMSFPNYFTSALAHDVDEDGHVDLLVTASDSSGNPGDNGKLLLFLGDGRGGNPTGLRLRTGILSGTVVSADFDENGSLDLAVADEGGSDVQVRLGDGSSGFGEPRTLVGVTHPEHLLAADWNRDGHVDLATANSSVADVSFLAGDGSGGFAPAVRFAVGSQPYGVAAGDVNEDGSLDLLSANFGADSVSVLLNDGAGAFAAPRTFTVGSRPESLVATDLDEDGHLDVAAANGFGHDVSLLAGNGAGDFAPIGTVAVSRYPRVIIAEDLDRDGHADLATASWGDSGASVLLGDGTGRFGAASFFPSEASATSLASADIDGDGAVDLALTCYHGNVVSVLLGDGGGRFSSAWNVAVGHGPDTVITPDLDLDGRPDLVASNWRSNTLTVLHNRGIGPCRSGRVNAGAGRVANVLFVNDSVGGAARRLSVATYEPFSIFMSAPPAADRAMPFALYVWAGPPADDMADVLPYGIGTSCMPTPLSRRAPAPAVIWNNTGKRRLGVASRPSSPAPSLVYRRPGGLGRRVTFFLQGIIADPGSAGTRRASVTNGVLVEAR